MNAGVVTLGFPPSKSFSPICVLTIGPFQLPIVNAIGYDFHNEEGNSELIYNLWSRR